MKTNKISFDFSILLLWDYHLSQAVYTTLGLHLCSILCINLHYLLIKEEVKDMMVLVNSLKSGKHFSFSNKQVKPFYANYQLRA